ncbi:MAG: radical SAM protein [Clostridiales bacterium]|nr:radical SAM protein [Clostridiales bacterium]
MYICELCPRECRVDREIQKGYCGMGLQPKIARAALHFWEEPCISGTRGSGTIFFSGCTLRCAYCQNYPISHEGQGKEITPYRLAEIFKMLEEKGAHNINLVTGTPFVPAILEALSIYKPHIPMLWNCGGYEKVETLKLLEGAIDIYLPDFKHVSPRLSALCAGAPDYFERASQAILEMCRQTGAPQYDENGILQKGTLIRHLILPGCTMDSIKVLNYIAENIPKGTPVSLMRQYSPVPWCKIKGLDRRVTDAEYERVLSHYQLLELSGYTQEKESADTAYTPPFDLTGV